MTAPDYRTLSLWHETGGDDLAPRAPLPGDVDADIAIIGGGLTGLWTAWYLLEGDPALSIVVLEKEIAGFGASGRNGGWCSALFPRSTASLERQHGRDAARAMREAMIATVDEVGRTAASAGIVCDFVKGGTIAYARDRVQLAAARAEVADAATYGVDPIEAWEPERVGASGALGATFDPNCARLHPAKLVRGLASALEERGVRIAEQTEVLDWSSGSVRTTRGTVRCETVVVALEGYSATLRQVHRRVLPIYSLMIATEPLPDAVWDELRLPHGRTFTDFRHLLIYGQRTADNRFAFGGRGAGYHWGSRIEPGFDRVPRIFDHLHRTLGELFPAIGDVPVTHRWGGPLGIARDWHASACFDSATRIGSAGGYVGDGLSTTNLAGRTLADLIHGRATELTSLPWVNHRSRSWEPEPLRFLGANAGLLATGMADVEERVTRHPSLIARMVAPLTGH